MKKMIAFVTITVFMVLQNVTQGISPDDFSGNNDVEKLQAAVNYSIANGLPAITIDREYNLTGGTVYINKGIKHSENGYNYARKILSFVGKGVGKILKNDTGFMFSANSRAGDVSFERITFSSPVPLNGLSSIISGLKCFDCDKIIRITTTNCTFRFMDYIWYQSGPVTSNMQSVRSLNDTFTKNNIILHFNQAWDIRFLNGLMEDGNQFMTCNDVNSSIRNLVINSSCIEGMSTTAIDLDCVHYGTKIENNYFEANLNHISMTRSNEGVSISRNSFFGRSYIPAATLIKCIEIALGNDSITVTGNLATETNPNTTLVSIDTNSVFNANYYNLIGTNTTFGATLTNQPSRVFQLCNLIANNIVIRDYITSPSGSNMNDYEVNSVKVFDNVPNGTIANQPSGWNGGVVETRGTANYIRQTAYNRTDAQVFYRNSINSVWTNWVNTSAALKGEISYDPPSIAHKSYTAKDITVSGVEMGDFVMASFSLDIRDLQLNGQVTSPDKITCTFYNCTGQTVDLGTGILRVKIIKK